MNRNRKYRSDFLFPTPSFTSGTGSVLNIAGKYFLFNYSASEQEADARAIESDWGVVGEDFKTAGKQVEQQLTHSNQ